MLFTTVFLVAIGILNLACTHHLPSLMPRQGSPVAECAPAPFQIRQFNTYNGTDSTFASVSFYLINENLGPEVFCIATIASAEGCQSDTYWKGPDPGIVFQWTLANILSVWQNITCQGGIYAGDAIQVEARAYIDTESLPDGDRGWHSESIVGTVVLPVVQILPIG